MGLFSVSYIKRKTDAQNTLFKLIFLLYDNLEVITVTTVKWKDMLQIHSFPTLFLYPV